MFEITAHYPGLLAAFLVVRPPLFGLGRGPITPLGPAMVVIDRKDLNSKTKQKQTNEITATISCQYLLNLIFVIFADFWHLT